MSVVQQTHQPVGAGYADPTHDLEAKSHSYDHEKSPDADVEVHSALDDHEIIQKHRSGFLGSLWAVVAKLDSLGVEARGIERVPANERTQTSVWTPFWIWVAANSTVSTVALGTLGANIWKLGLRDAVLTILFFNLLGTLPVAYFSVWGARFGLRQMTIGRFSFGAIAIIFPTILNLIACVGWSAINAIAGASALHAVTDTNQLPEWAGILIISLVTLVVTGFGSKVVHAYERYSWPIPAVIFVIMFGLTVSSMESGAWGGTGPIEAAGVLSFGAAIVGFGIGWSSLAADYTCYMREDVPSWKVFMTTYMGLNIPLVLLESLGAMLLTTLNNRPDWAARYDSDGFGGLLRASLSRMGGFGQFCTVLLGLSIIGNNIPNYYSFALTFQVLGKAMQSIPRVFLTVVACVISIAIAIPAAGHFESALDTLLVLLAYWLAIYTTILIEEHLIFRRGYKGYNVDSYDIPKLLPCGYAAAFAVCCGIAGAVLGMASVWYVGPVSRLIGLPEYGGDIGFELSGGFAALTYPPARYLEKRIFKR